ncbi:hypothetical protein CAOG_05071 [Capsaspora owczarzaki ATCC 30864]|uniref:Myb-like domain-containing protein n=1 Tax=Capsaspora owczarzaki (strain ATCC 30864) TaxID=595528 RepID=A0A0D2WSI3_CAPO3|nr:hypothetical protein CAOG_05071 [Capsaspora owczarzaki ATCC 30864]KJE94428.1 hypothetical protein CAOG_005071 [Capsaspora owczarzaki ATCC 30864]|eukprot:XP_004346756.1 hypothetical protein CAOG_05071 [Capsaspora owczarzaki ATCC 30864]
MSPRKLVPQTKPTSPASRFVDASATDGRQHPRRTAAAGKSQQPAMRTRVPSQPVPVRGHRASALDEGDEGDERSYGHSGAKSTAAAARSSGLQQQQLSSPARHRPGSNRNTSAADEDDSPDEDDSLDEDDFRPKHRNLWTTAEIAALKQGVEKLGVGKWTAIRNDPRWSHILSRRTPQNLYDRYRVAGFRMRRQPREQPFRKFILLDADHKPVMGGTAKSPAPVVYGRGAAGVGLGRVRHPRDAALKAAKRDDLYSPEEETCTIYLREVGNQCNQKFQSQDPLSALPMHYDVVYVFSGSRHLIPAPKLERFANYSQVWTTRAQLIRREPLKYGRFAVVDESQAADESAETEQKTTPKKKKSAPSKPIRAAAVRSREQELSKRRQAVEEAEDDEDEDEDEDENESLPTIAQSPRQATTVDRARTSAVHKSSRSSTKPNASATPSRAPGTPAFSSSSSTAAAAAASSPGRAAFGGLPPLRFSTASADTEFLGF